MGCIEMQTAWSVLQKALRINRNMGCIEIMVDGRKMVRTVG